MAKRHNLIKSPRRAKRRSHRIRARLPREGMLIHFDGSEHLWFRDTKTDLIAGIDDAAGKIVAAEFFGIYFSKPVNKGSTIFYRVFNFRLLRMTTCVRLG